MGSNTKKLGSTFKTSKDHKKKHFIWESGDDQAIDLSFDHKNIMGRREWIKSFKVRFINVICFLKNYL